MRDRAPVWFRRQKDGPRARPPYSGPIALAPIGHVRNAVTAPRPHGWGRVESRIVLAPEHVAKAAGIEAYSHVVVVCYLDLAADAPDKPDTITLANGHRYGILATRSQLRPNHLGVSVAALAGVEDGTLLVRGLDAIDGTAVLDIKPYLPDYDARPDARIPPG